MRKLFAFGALLLLAACASTIPNQSPASRLFAIQADYTVLVAAGARYNELPRCERHGAPALCSKASAVAEIRKADAIAAGAIGVAQEIVRTPGYDRVTASSAIAAALRAVTALQSILATYDIK
ncbi:MAG: hypothetical protein ACK4JB_17365 [Reyranella sp.]